MAIFLGKRYAKLFLIKLKIVYFQIKLNLKIVH